MPRAARPRRRPTRSPCLVRRSCHSAPWGHKGPGVTRPARRTWGSSGGCAKQAFADRGLSVGSDDGEAATDGGVEEFVNDGGTLVAPGGGSDLLQQRDRVGE
jgi:hypothetical protein